MSERADFSAVDLPVIEELPDPFLFANGDRARSRSDWERRREELKEAVQRCAYGRLPPAGGSTTVEEASSERGGAAGATERTLRLAAGPGGAVQARLILTVPNGGGPFPVAVSGDLGWGKVKPEIAAEVARRGYALAEFDRTEIAVDANRRSGGLYDAFPNSDFGALAAWAWGFHRVVDYLLTLPEIDAGRIVATGHSRGGKAALLAGALDERIAVTAPNNSGCMGAGCTRIPHEGETLERIVAVFPYWFSPKLEEFVGREDRLPFDQHSVKALVAPRALLSTEGMEDHWANPEGTQLTYQAAREVYEFLGARDEIGIVFRPGGHGHTLPDWRALLDFADARLFGKTSARPFDERPYPDSSTRAYSWSRPGEAGR
jgi:hypothetical protein